MKTFYLNLAFSIITVVTLAYLLYYVYGTRETHTVTVKLKVYESRGKFAPTYRMLIYTDKGWYLIPSSVTGQIMYKAIEEGGTYRIRVYGHDVYNFLSLRLYKKVVSFE